MFHIIKTVVPLPEYKLSVRFSEGTTKIYDVAKLFETIPVFRSLTETPGAFANVSVDVGGHGIVWNDDVDLSSDELWDNGMEVRTPFDGLIAFRDASELWGLNESTLRKAVLYGKLKSGIDVCKVGKQWVVTAEAMQREYGQNG